MPIRVRFVYAHSSCSNFAMKRLLLPPPHLARWLCRRRCLGWRGQLLLVAKNSYFATHAVVADSRQPADCLMIVSRGLVEMCLPVREGGRVLSVLRRG